MKLTLEKLLSLLEANKEQGENQLIVEFSEIDQEEKDTIIRVAKIVGGVALQLKTHEEVYVKKTYTITQDLLSQSEPIRALENEEEVDKVSFIEKLPLMIDDDEEEFDLIQQADGYMKFTEGDEIEQLFTSTNIDDRKVLLSESRKARDKFYQENGTADFIEELKKVSEAKSHTNVNLDPEVELDVEGVFEYISHGDFKGVFNHNTIKEAEIFNHNIKAVKKAALYAIKDNHEFMSDEYNSLKEDLRHIIKDNQSDLSGVKSGIIANYYVDLFNRFFNENGS